MQNEYELSPQRLRERLQRLSQTRPRSAQAIATWLAERPRAGGREAPATPEVTRPVDRKVDLTIGMATFDDYDGAYFTAQAIRMYHPEVTERTEILVVDNNPGGPASAALKSLDGKIPGFRYFPYGRSSGTAVRDIVFREAAGRFAMCVDSHILLAPGSLQKLLRYFDEHPETDDLLQGPMIYDDLARLSTHMEPRWRDGMYGTWAFDPRGASADAEPFEIPMQGLGVFACRRAAWPGFNPRFTGFGGEEGYLQEKFRRRGAKTLCLPFLRWLHRFGRPLGGHYRNTWEDRIRNYEIGFTELGLDTEPIYAHFSERLGEVPAREIRKRVRADVSNPFLFFDAIYCINLDRAADRWKRMTDRFAALGIDWRVRRFPAIETPASHHVGCALSHRRIVEEAKRQGLRNVLVFEDDAVFLDDTIPMLEAALRELNGLTWGLFYLGGHRWDQPHEPIGGCRLVMRPRQMTCTHAVAYSERIFDRLLDAVPETPESVERWLRDVAGIDQFYARTLRQDSVVTWPSLVSQPSILGQELDDLRPRYI